MRKAVSLENKMFSLTFMCDLVWRFFSMLTSIEVWGRILNPSKQAHLEIVCVKQIMKANIFIFCYLFIKTNAKELIPINLFGSSKGFQQFNSLLTNTHTQKELTSTHCLHMNCFNVLHENIFKRWIEILQIK